MSLKRSFFLPRQIVIDIYSELTPKPSVARFSLGRNMRLNPRGERAQEHLPTLLSYNFYIFYNFWHHSTPAYELKKQKSDTQIAQHKKYLINLLFILYIN